MGSGPPGLEVADAALRSGSPDIALQVANGVVARNPGNESALLTQGEALTALGRSDEAAASFQAVLAQNPQSIGALIGLGRLRLGSDPMQAETLFLQALAREPRNGIAFNNLGIARDLQGRHREAQAAYRQALGVSPEMRAAQVNLALSLAMGGQAGEAVQLLRPLAQTPGASRQVQHDLAAVLVMNGNRAEAERILSRDLPPHEVQEALNAYAAGRGAAGAGLMTTAPAETPIGLPLAAGAGTVATELAAPSASRAEAETNWQQMRRQMPDLLGGRQPLLVQDGRTWRVRLGGFADAGEADAFCRRVRDNGTGCVVAP